MNYDVGMVRRRRVIPADEAYFAAPGQGSSSTAVTNGELREDSSFELREDVSIELRE